MRCTHPGMYAAQAQAPSGLPASRQDRCGGKKGE